MDKEQSTGHRYNAGSGGERPTLPRRFLDFVSFRFDLSGAWHPWISTRIWRWSNLALAASAAGLWAFIEIAEEVVEGSTHAVDEKLVLLFRTAGDLSDPLGPPWLEEAVRDFTALGGVAVLTLITLAVIGFLLVARSPRAAIAVAAAVSGGMLISSLLKLSFDRPRPDLVPHGPIVYTSSFPSGHSMMAAAVYLTLGTMVARVLPDMRMRAYVISVSIAVSILVGLSRVYLGVHWPTDVLAGWVLGASWALICGVLMWRLQLKRQVEPTLQSDS
jgi:undecaprenyl-diphosphatase